MAGTAPSLSKRTYAVGEKKRTFARGFSTVFGKGLHQDQILDKFRPVTIVSIMSFDKPLSAKDLRQVVSERLISRWDRFRSRMFVQGSHVVFETLEPEELDLSYHVTEENSEGWDEDDWHKFLTRIYSTVKDVERPLWRWHICNNLKNGQSRVVWNLDHCVCDGVSVAYCVNALFDPDETATHVPPPKLKKGGDKRISTFSVPQPGLLSKAWWMVEGIAEGILAPLMPGDEMSSMKVKDIQRPSKEKRYSNAKTLCLSQVNELKNKFGVTVNDVLGGLLNMTIQRYLEETEPEKHPNERSIRINFPINMRSPASMMNPMIRNEISTGMIRVLLNHKSTVHAIMEHHLLMQRIKNSPAPRVQMMLLNVLSKVVPYELLVAIAFILYGKFTLMMSNVPGPPKARPIFGNMCTDVHFYLFVPIGIYCGLISYDGRVSFTVSTDGETETRPEKITEIWKEEFDKLYAEATARDFAPTWEPPTAVLGLPRAGLGLACVGAGAVIAFALLRRRS